MRPRDADTGAGDEQPDGPRCYQWPGQVGAEHQCTERQSDRHDHGGGGDQTDDRASAARRDALAISDSVQPTASTAPKNPAAAGTMPARR